MTRTKSASFSCLLVVVCDTRNTTHQLRSAKSLVAKAAELEPESRARTVENFLTKPAKIPKCQLLVFKTTLLFYFCFEGHIWIGVSLPVSW